MSRERGLNVLLAGHLNGSTDAIADSLRNAGFAVTIAADSPTALAAVREGPSDAVVYGVPTTTEGDEFGLARELIAQAGWRKPLVVALTEHGNSAAERRALDAGVHLYAETPTDPAVLPGLLHRFRSLLADIEGFDPVI